MLSYDGFRHHLGIIEHETKMYHFYKHEVSLESVKNSKEVLNENFKKQHNRIEQLEKENEKMKKDLGNLRKYNLYSDFINRIEELEKEVDQLKIDKEECIKSQLEEILTLWTGKK